MLDSYVRICPALTGYPPDTWASSDDPQASHSTYLPPRGIRGAFDGLIRAGEARTAIYHLSGLAAVELLGCRGREQLCGAVGFLLISQTITEPSDESDY